MNRELFAVLTLHATAGFWAVACLIAARTRAGARAGLGEPRLHRMLWIPLGTVLLLTLAFAGKPNWMLLFPAVVTLMLCEYASDFRHPRVPRRRSLRSARIEVLTPDGDVHFDDESPGEEKRLLAEIFDEAIVMQASDIEVEEEGTTFFVTPRVDGCPRPSDHRRALRRRLGKRLTTTLMTVANAAATGPDASRRGRFRVRRNGLNVDVRLTKSQRRPLRLRLHDPMLCKELDKIVWSPETLSYLKGFLGQPGGLLVICGPSGHGKTTTAYATLSYLDDYTRSIRTIETPVEVDLGGSIEQASVDSPRGYGADCLRKRPEDRPDTLFVGRADAGTAEVVEGTLKAGCRVITTLDADDVVDALHKLSKAPIDIAGVPRVGFLMQRLVLRQCAACRERNSRARGVPRIGSHLAKVTGWRRCGDCDGGFRGRIAVFEFLEISPGTVGRLRSTRPTRQAIETELRNQGRRSMRDYGGDLIAKGIVDRAELERVLGA